MYTSKHDIGTLFQQLGLPAGQQNIAQFVRSHTLEPQVQLAEAPFWTASQAAFLRQAIEEDANWAEPVDELDAQLRQTH